MQIRKLGMRLGVVALGATAMLAITPHAQADEPVTEAASCANPLHTYQDYNYQGGYKKFCHSDSDLSNNEFNNGVRVDNRISSVKNLNGCTWTLYQHTGYSGRRTAFQPWSWDANLGNNDIGDNKTSSLKQTC